VDKTAEACYACHSQSQPLAHVNRPDRFRIYRDAAGTRILGIITPIENQPSCSNAACHAHPAEQKILGVLDTNLSLAKADVQLAESTRRMVVYTSCALLLIAVLSWFVVWRVVGRPVKALQHGTDHLAAGDLGYQIEVHSRDEIGKLARSFNGMTHELATEHNENVLWTQTLEQRVEQKTRELKRAHEHALHTEKMASIGKMAAVLAHEINNPLSGILPRIFEPFLTTKETGRGVGLGLAISQNILERHHGSIEVQSEVGRGTTFTLTLPWEGSTKQHDPSPTGEVAAAASGRG